MALVAWHWRYGVRYAEWLELVAAFSVQSCAQWTTSSNSLQCVGLSAHTRPRCDSYSESFRGIYVRASRSPSSLSPPFLFYLSRRLPRYVLSLWVRLVAAVPYVNPLTRPDALAAVALHHADDADSDDDDGGGGGGGGGWCRGSGRDSCYCLLDGGRGCTHFSHRKSLEKKYLRGCFSKSLLICTPLATGGGGGEAGRRAHAAATAAAEKQAALMAQLEVAKHCTLLFFCLGRRCHVCHHHVISSPPLASVTRFRFLSLFLCFSPLDVH